MCAVALLLYVVACCAVEDDEMYLFRVVQHGVYIPATCKHRQSKPSFHSSSPVTTPPHHLTQIVSTAWQVHPLQDY